MFQKRLLIAKIVLLILFLATAPMALATQLKPLEELKSPLDSAIAILNDPKYKVEGESLKAQQRDQLWKVVNSIFDFKEVSKRALARHWRKFTDAEQKKFSEVFGTFLGNTYLDRIQGEYHNEKIVYGDQQIIKKKWAIVKTKIKRETLEIPVDYRMKRIDGRWKVIDVTVEGISLVKNYRTQFNNILRKEKPVQLIERLEKKSINSK